VTDKRDEEPRLGDLLRERPLPGERQAEERAWRVVSAAFEERADDRPRPAMRHGRGRLAIALAALLALGAIALTPAGAEVGDWIEDTFDPGQDDAKPAIFSLPAQGPLLVSSGGDSWVVQPDGSKRRLAGYDEASWSPSGLFVVAARSNELFALEPDGDIRWSLGRPDVNRPAWSLDAPDTRIAYRSGSDLRVVAGDGTGDRLLASRVAPATPAWQPGARNTLAYVDARGRVVVAAADSRRALWRSAPGPSPGQLAWAMGGRRLVAVSPRVLRLFDASGRQVATRTLPPGLRAGALAVEPSGVRAALVLVEPLARRSEVVSLSLDSGRLGRRMFAGDGRFSELAWSPDGRWLLVAWPDADQWLFIRSARVRKILSVSNITRQFNPEGGGFPRLAGWCCG
jgi:hypothetical protein